MKLTLTPIVMSAALAMMLTACGEPDGPAEQAGEKIDHAMEKAGDKMEEAGDAIERKTDN